MEVIHCNHTDKQIQQGTRSVHPSSEVVVRFYFATKFSSEIVSPPLPPTPPHPTPQKGGGASPSLLFLGVRGWGGVRERGENYLATKISSSIDSDYYLATRL